MSTVTVSKGSSYSVSSGQTDTNDTVLSGGTMSILSGGVASSTLVEAGGVLIVDAGGTEVGLTNSGTVRGSGGVISGTVVNGGLVEASGTDAYLALVGSTTNSKGKIVEAIAAGSGGFAELVLGGPVSNSGTIEALATAAGSIAYVDIGGSVNNTSGRIVASGNGIIDLVGGAVISGGTLQTVGTAAAIAAYPSGSGTIVSAAIVSNSLVAARGGTLTLSAVTFGADDKLEATAGGTLVVSGGAAFGVGTLAEAVTGGTLDIDGTVANAGAVEALAGSPGATAAVTLSGGSIGNSGSMIALAGAASGSASVTISGGTVSNSRTIMAEATVPNALTLFSGGDATVTIDATSVTNAGTLEALAVSGGVAATNVSATTIGNTGVIKALASSAGEAIMEFGGTVSNAKSAFMVASATGSNSSAGVGGASGNAATVSNSGTIEALAQGGATATIDIAGTNRGTIVASAGADSDAFVLLDTTIDNTGGRIVASAGSGATAQIILEDGAVISGGTLQTVGAGAAISVFPFESATVSSAAIAANSHIIVGQNALGDNPVSLALDNDTFGAGTVVEVTDRSTLSINGGLNLSAGSLIEVRAFSTATISGNVNNAGTIEAIGDGETAVSISGDTLTNTGTIAYLAGPTQNTPEFTIGVTSALVNSGTLEIVATGPGLTLVDGLRNANSVSPELDISAGTIKNTGSIVASAGLLDDEDADIATLNLHASAGFVNSGTISVVATANLPFGAQFGEALISASISAGTDFANTGTIKTMASSTFPPESVHIVSASTVVSAAGDISNGGLIVASATGAPGNDNANAAISLIAGGTVFNSGTIAASNSTSTGAGPVAEVLISGATVINTKTIEAISIVAGASLDIDGGTIINSGLIEGAVVNGTTVSNAKAGTILGGAGGAVAGDTVVNLGLIEVSATSHSAGSQLEGTTISNGGTIEALGSGIGRAEFLVSGVVDNSGGTLRASGNAEIDLDNVTISGGVVATSGSSAAIVVSAFASASISTASIAAGSLVEATSGGTLTLGSGTLIGKGATVEAINGGMVVLSGTVTNSGALLAEQGGSVVITSGASVSGGVAEIGASGAVVISGDSTENVTFLSGALSGGLDLADTAADPAGYGGTVSGFGGLNNTDTTQFIDLTSVTYSAGVESASYVANASHPTSGGVLTVMSGGVTVADINLAGNYTHAAFDIVSGANNTVEIIDPASFIAGGGTATLASPASDTSSPINHVGAASVALLVNYMASLFPSPQGQVVTPGAEPQQNQAVLAHPHTG